MLYTNVYPFIHPFIQLSLHVTEKSVLDPSVCQEQDKVSALKELTCILVRESNR